MRLYFCLVGFLLLVNVRGEILINEVMYNPSEEQGSDSELEWIELYSNNSFNLNGYYIDGDEIGNFTFNNSYLIISRDLDSFEEYYGNNDSIWNTSDGNYSVVEVSISLTNTEDIINLSHENYSEILAYSSAWGGDGNGYTIERIDPLKSNEKNNWGSGLVLGGTPGEKNSLFGINNDVDILINEFLPDPYGEDDAPLPEGEWIELYSEQNIDLKWYYLEDNAGHRLYITDTNVISDTITDPYLVVYTNGFFGFLNNEDDELFLYNRDAEKIQEVSYGFSKEGNSYSKIDGFGWQNTVPTPNAENIPYGLVKDSNFSIENILDLGGDDEAKFGQIIRVRINIYKGDESKEVIRIWAEGDGERITKESKITMPERYTKSTFTVPLMIKPNCNENYDDNDYFVHVGWFNSIEVSKEFRVRGITKNNCETIYTEVKSDDKISFDVSQIAGNVKANSDLNAKVKFDNPNNEDFLFKVTSYIYRGNKRYSEEEINYVNIKSNSQKEIVINNSVGDVKPGEYKVKFLFLKEGRKTADQKTFDLRIDASEKSEATPVEVIERVIFRSDDIIYESETFFVHKIIPVILIILFILALVFSVTKDI